MKNLSKWSQFLALTTYLFVTTAMGQTIVGPGEAFPVNASTAEDFVLNGGTLVPKNVTLTGTIELASDSGIIRLKNPLISDPRGGSFEQTLGPTNIDGPITGAGDLTLGNYSRDQFLIHGVNTYAGHTYAIAGNVLTSTSTAFGSAAEGTTIQGANVVIGAPTDEQFRIEAGSLTYNAGDFVPTNPVTLAGGKVSFPNVELYETPIALDAIGGTAAFGYSDTSSWTGGSSGTGDLTLVGRVSVDAPLTHDGDLYLDGVRLNAVNTYTGRTIIQDNYVIDRPDVFGVSTTPLEITDGRTTVQVLPNGNRGFNMMRGTLDIQTTEPINSDTKLGGIFEAAIEGIGTFNGAIDYETITGGGNASIQGGVFNGSIRGNTLLRLGGDDGVTLNAANDIQGLVDTTGGLVTVNHADALPLPATLLQGGTIELNVSANSLPIMSRYPYGSQQTGMLLLNADQDFNGLTYVGEGTLNAAADVRFDRLFARNAEITSAGQGSVEIAGELSTLGSSILTAKVTGTGALRGVGTNLSVQGDLSDFQGDLVVESGTLQLDATTPLGSGAIHVRDQGQLIISAFQNPDYVVDNDIYLYNVNPLGPGYPSALHYSTNGLGKLILRGRLDVGENGSTISSNDEILVQGNITGNNLTLRNASFFIEAPQTQLGGSLRVRDSALILDGQGSLFGLDSILVEKGGYLDIEANAAGTIDRIADSIAIHSQGGRISLYHNLPLNGSETLGTLVLEGGTTELVGTSDTPLMFENIDRKPGSLLLFSEHSGVSGVGFVNPPPLQNGMLGAWATTESGFATLDGNNRFMTLAPTSSDLNTAGPTDHVNFSGSATLQSDKTIASLQIDPTGNPHALDLNSHLLTIVSGGIYRSPEISNGQITAGDGGPTELILHNSQEVSASIVDHPGGGPVSLVVNGSLRLSGSNTYSGSTWVHGDGSSDNRQGTLQILSLDAIPQGNRMIVDGANLQMLSLPEGIIELSELRLRNNGLVQGFNAPIDAANFDLEDGVINAPLTGQGKIFKDTIGTVSFSNAQSPEFYGTAHVLAGQLIVDAQALPNTSFEVSGGRLESTGSSYMNNSISLDGGELLGNFGGSISVARDSTLYHGNGYTLLRGQLSGESNLTIRGERTDRYVGIFGDANQFTGDLVIHTGALRIGAPAQLGAGEIYVHEGAQLTLGSDRPSYGITVLDRNVHIERGTLYVTPPSDIFADDTPPGLITGNVTVHDLAFFGANDYGVLDNERGPGLEFGGGLILADGAAVIGKTRDNAVFFSYDVPLIEVSGHLDVGRENLWRLELASLKVSGAIRAAADESSIDFQGLASFLQLNRATLVADAGRSLSITVNGQARDVQLDAPEAGLAGGGVIVGNFDLSNGATVAPGSSPGTLTIAGDLGLGPGATYQWEFAGGTGGPGAAWDLLTVDGPLSFDATAAAPWVLEINDLNDALTLEDSEWLIASASSTTGFDPDAVMVDISNLDERFRQSNDPLFSVEMRDNDLFLVLMVPEPTSSICLCCLSLALSMARCVRRGCIG